MGWDGLTWLRDLMVIRKGLRACFNVDMGVV